MNAYPLFVMLCLSGLLHGCVTESAPARPTPASDEDAAMANLSLGAAYVRQGRPDLAVEALERAIRIAPRMADAHSTLAIAYDQLNNPELAENHYRRATELDTANSSAANSYAVFLCRQRRWNDAEQFFLRAVENPRYPTPDVALTNAGICARDAQDLSKAEQYFRSALARNDAAPGALVGMMELAYDNANYLGARAFMQRYMASQNATAPVLWMCVRIERELNNPSEAQVCEARLIDEFPESPEAETLRQLSSNAR
jgi:type IV pilus assembly protein PilF